MFTGSPIAEIAIPVLFIILDIYFVITLSFPRDERNQIIVWKAASFTLMGVFGAYLIKVIVRMVNGLPRGILRAFTRTRYPLARSVVTPGRTNTVHGVQAGPLNSSKRSAALCGKSAAQA